MNNGDKPIVPMPYTNKDGSIQHDVYYGLTKREYFSAAAMQGLCSIPNTGITIEGIAKRSVQMADILLEELNK